MDSEITLHGSDNENINSESYGYSQAVSGLIPMTDEYDKMFTAECKYWNTFKQDNSELWKKQLKRFRYIRGTIFTDRLLKCIKWCTKNIDVIRTME
ncbi:MAG: hypothetical protein KZQ83_00485 [gamma proteobacterium symbiont of Taylorina sp.]|nr:hypothetical protein [gamma proteobacterium symbiont of Taylorina sp.]